jgi:hypothetical protein
MPSSPPKWRSGSRFFAVPALRPTKLLRSQAGPSTGGLPLSVVVGRAEITDAPQAGGLGRTYGGNALGYAAALAVLDAFEQDGLLERFGERLEAGLPELARKHSIIGDMRGLGFRQAIHQPLSRANGKPARTQYRDREVFQLHRAETPNREKRPTFVGSAGYPTVSQGQLYQPPTAKPRTVRPQMSAP